MDVPQNMVLQMAKTLIETAAKHGLVVRIETIPHEPLAMGNYTMHATVHEKRVPAIPYDKLEGFVSLDTIHARKWRAFCAQVAKE